MTTDTPTAVVTGGCAGLGLVIGRRLAQDGFRVIAVDIAAGELAPAEPPTDSSVEPTWVELDVRDHLAVGHVFDDLAARYGGLDVLVNNAGIQLHGDIEDLTVEAWRAVLDVNLNGVFHCLQAAGRRMLRQGRGAIVNISSVAARGAAGRAPYATSKAALFGLTATAAAEWAARGVRVNAVAPGYIDTGVYREGVASGALDPAAITKRIPAARLARPEEIADVVSYLSSERSSYVTGQTIFVDGGFSVDYGVPLMTTRKT